MYIENLKKKKENLKKNNVFVSFLIISFKKFFFLIYLR